MNERKKDRKKERKKERWWASLRLEMACDDGGGGDPLPDGCDGGGSACVRSLLCCVMYCLFGWSAAVAGDSSVQAVVTSPLGGFFPQFSPITPCFFFFPFSFSAVFTKQKK